MIQASGIEGQDIEFITEKITVLEKELSDTAAVQQIISNIPDMQARLYASLHYEYGFLWREIGEIFHISDDVIRMRVKRYLGKIVGK